jgi:hypothetical protein
MTPKEPPAGVAGWLLVLCAILIVLQPLSIAFAAASVLDSILIRGAAAWIVLGVRMAVAAFGAGAGMALLLRRESGGLVATLALAATAATEAFVVVTPFFPNNRVPGDEPYYVAAIAAA